MSLPPPFSLRIFVADGDPDGLRIVDRTNWNGKALVFPRAAWAQSSLSTRPELRQTGVYLLLGCVKTARVTGSTLARATRSSRAWPRTTAALPKKTSGRGRSVLSLRRRGSTSRMCGGMGSSSRDCHD